MKRKRAPGAGEQRTAYPHYRISGGEGATPFKARMLEKQTPVGVCVFALCGTVCLRVPCLMTDNRSTRQRSPSPRNSSINLGRRCRRLHHPDRLRCNSHNRIRQPQQGGGADGGGGGGLQPPSFTRYSRTFTRLMAGAEHLLGVERDAVIAATDSTGLAIRRGGPKGEWGR